MPEYYIEWRIELDAEDEEDAARKALAIQRNPESTATVFHVATTDSTLDNNGFLTIDLTEIDNGR